MPGGEEITGGAAFDDRDHIAVAGDNDGIVDAGANGDGAVAGDDLHLPRSERAPQHGVVGRIARAVADALQRGAHVGREVAGLGGVGCGAGCHAVHRMGRVLLSTMARIGARGVCLLYLRG